MNVTVIYQDETSIDYQCTRLPWQYANSLVLDEGDGRLTYIPLAVVSSWRADNPRSVAA